MRLAARRTTRRLLSLTPAGRRVIALYRLSDLRPYLERIGWLRSYEEQLPVDGSGESLPWFTYAAISFLAPRVRPEMSVFEYGSGNSTFWWSTRVRSVVSYEHDAQWFQHLKPRIPPNVDYHFCALSDDTKYSSAITRFHRQIDVVVIDGRDRVNCAKNSLGALAEGGVIIWDNSDRVKYQEGYAFLADHGFKRLDFEGLGPIGIRSWCTSVFYRQPNCLGI